MNRPLRIVVAHNAYREAGGEDAVVAAEVELLSRNGHDVVELRRDNGEIDTGRPLALAARTLWSRRDHAAMTALAGRHRADVVHIHNTLPLLSPSVHWAAAAAGSAVVQTLHNFRLACPQAMFLRDGRPCEDCLGRAPLPAVRHGCYRGSRAQTAVVATMLVGHRALGTWQRKVDRFVALTAFGRQKFIEAGIDADRIAVKPHFVDAPDAGSAPRRGFLFVGRLGTEKGIDVLARAMAQAGEAELTVIGTGPEAARLRGVASLRLLGAKRGEEVRAAMVRARALVVPSICYETFGRVVVEAYAAGLPVIASRIGSLAELVDDGVTGLLVGAGDDADLARAIRWADDHPAAMEAMGRQARARHEALYTPQANHRQLMAIYAEAIESRRVREDVS